MLNINSLANDAGISFITAKEWLSLLEASFIIFRLNPYSNNTGKRLVKSSKLYFYDCGLAAYLIGIDNVGQIKNPPLGGALFETLIVSETVKYRVNRGMRSDLLFYRDSNNNEVDLLVPKMNTFIAIEIKSGATLSKNYFSGIKNFK